MPLRRALPASLATLLLAVAGLSCTSSGEPPAPRSVTLSVATANLDAIGATRVVIATVRDQDDRPINGAGGVDWTTDDPAVATVSGSGVITAVGNGDAVITASLGNLSATVAVVVAQVPVAPVAFAGNSQSATHSTTLANPVQVRIEDRLGSPIVGAAVTFSVLSGGGSIGSPATTSGANGLAATTWTLGSSTTVPQRLTAAVVGTPATTVLLATALAGPPTALARAPGNTAQGQVGNIGEPVPIRPAVIVRDAVGNPVAGANVLFSVSGGGGSTTGATVETDGGGIAMVGSWTLGALAGPNTLTASLPAAPAVPTVAFDATAVTDRCSREGAQPIAVGDTVQSNLGGTDCQATFQDGPARYEYYRLDLTAQTGVFMEMNALFDTWLELRHYQSQALIIENDDIVRAQITDSRIGIVLDSGSYLIRARGFDAGQTGDYRLFIRLGLIGVPAQIERSAPDGQVAAPGTSVATSPAVIVRDELGTPVIGASVTFATVGGLGALTGADAQTDNNGVATVGAWFLSAGTNVLTATVASPNPVAGSPAIFSARGKNSTAGFDISLRFSTVPTTNQLATFNNAATRWESVLTGDLPGQPIANLPVNECGNRYGVNETADDVIIFVNLAPIDGPGSILGSAGPCEFRAGPSYLPAAGSMTFDAADLGGLEASGMFNAVILHEMGHVLGIGTLWTVKGFLQLQSPTTGPGNDTHFNGPNAVAAFNAAGGAAYVGGKVPVENSQGGAGTRNAHWRESVLDFELMTGFLDGGIANPLSAITVQSMLDLGYTVDAAAADVYTLPAGAGLRAEGEAGGGKIALGNDIRVGPTRVRDRFGRVIGGSAVRPAKPRKGAR